MSNLRRFTDLIGVDLLTDTALPDKLAKRGDMDALSEAEQQALTVIERIYGKQVAEVTATLQDSSDPRSAVAARWPALQALFQQQVLPLFDDLMGLATQEAAGLIDVAPNWEQVNEAALDYARERATALAMQSTTTSRAQVDRIIANWIDDGGTMPELLARVARVWSGQRARTTAISEVTHIYAAANRATWAASGVVKGYIVQSVRDETVCPICRKHQGERYAIDDTAHLPPYHGSCRCFIRPVVLSAKEFEAR